MISLKSPRVLAPTLLALIIITHHFRLTITTTLHILAMPILWSSNTSPFILSATHDNFDVTFSNYSIHKSSALPEYPDLIPPVLHHIALGSKARHGGAADTGGSGWDAARQKCLEFHEGWENHLWDDEKAGAFVKEKYPELLAMWEGYRFPIQRIDALRYMILYEYGGAVLDMDLECRRSLGPLRRFEFVAPAAHPNGFSNGFMMAQKGHQFVGEMVQNLKNYDRFWFWLPYPTVMFSTGCHYASTIHTLQPNRTPLKILGGTHSHRNLHRLNGHVITPLFHHLGSSSWHSYDAAIIMQLGKSKALRMSCFLGGFAIAMGIVGLIVFGRRRRARRGSGLEKVHEEVWGKEV